MGIGEDPGKIPGQSAINRINIKNNLTWMLNEWNT